MLRRAVAGFCFRILLFFGLLFPPAPLFPPCAFRFFQPPHCDLPCLAWQCIRRVSCLVPEGRPPLRSRFSPFSPTNLWLHGCVEIPSTVPNIFLVEHITFHRPPTHSILSPHGPYAGVTAIGSLLHFSPWKGYPTLVCSRACPALRVCCFLMLTGPRHKMYALLQNCS